MRPVAATSVASSLAASSRAPTAGRGGAPSPLPRPPRTHSSAPWRSAPRRPPTLCGGPQGGVFVLFTPADASERLIETIRRALPPEEQPSLIGPLRQVATLLTDANPANDRGACGRLDAFIDQVNAKEQSGEVTAAQATQLRQDAGDITAALGCP